MGYERFTNRHEVAILSGVLAILIVLSARPFGFRTFLEALSKNDPFAMALLISMIAIVFVLAQKLGLLNVKTESHNGINNQV